MANAVFLRELKIGLRSQRAFLAQVAFVLCLSLVMLLAWPKGEHVGLEASLSRSLFVTLGVSLITLITLLAPVFVAGSLTVEKEAGTLEMLLVSPVRPAQVARGKLAASVLYLVLLVLSALPVLGLCYFLGGVGGDEVLSLGMHLLGFTVLLGAIGLTASAVCGRTHGALVVTYLFAVPLGVLVVLRALLSREFYTVVDAISMNVVEAVLSAILFGRVVSRLSRPPSHAARPAEEERPEDQAVLQLRRHSFPDRWLWPEATKGHLRDEANPVYRKEVSCEIFGRGSGLVRTILVGTIVLSMVAGFFLMMGYAPVYFSYLNLCLLLIAPAFAANAFTQERERGTYDLLMTSLLEPGTILGGKFFAIVRFLGVVTVFLLVPLPISLLAWPDGGADLGTRLVMLSQNLAVLGGTLVVCTAVGLLASLVFRTSTAAIVGTYSTLFVFTIVPVAAFAVLTQFTRVPAADLIGWGVTSPFLASLSTVGWEGRDKLIATYSSTWVWAAYVGISLVAAWLGLMEARRRLSRSTAEA